MNLELLKQGDEPFMQFDRLALRNYLPSEIARLSAMKVTNAKSFDAVGQPISCGLYDDKMGPIDTYDQCGTCNLPELFCPGHVGHIELCVPVFNPVLYRFLIKLMKGSCVHCHRLTIDSTGALAQLFSARMRCLELGLPECIAFIEERMSEIGDNMRAVGDDDYVPFMEMVDKYIAEFMGKSIEQLRASSSLVKPHKILVDLRNNYLKDFTREMFKRQRVCRLCKQKNGTIIDDDARCLLIDFSTSTAKKKAPSALKKGGLGLAPDEEEEEEVELEPEDKEKKDDKNVLVGDASLAGADSLALQLKSVAAGTCEKLAWRGAEVREHFRLLWANDGRLLKMCFPMFEDETEGCPLDGLFCEVVMVPPNKFRPIRFFKGDRYEHPQTVNLRKLIEADEIIKCIVLLMGNNAGDKKQDFMDFIARSGVRGASMSAMMHNAYRNLQNRMNVIFDADLDKSAKDDLAIPGIKQILEKKQGLFRMNMMGKRVNYACRSVITPDPYLDIDEIGIPDVFAKKLTFTEPVSIHNVEEMRKFVRRGPTKYPGANFVMLSNGQKRILKEDRADERRALAKQLQVADVNKLKQPMKVLRHVKKGDLIVMNRQPSLHKPSMMGHRARILTGQRALRMNYAPCKAYNADFDGDEMNGHLTQSYQAQVEVGEIANVGNNFLVPKDASPLLGLIQDHVVSGVLLTLRGRMLSREDFMHLVLAAFAETPQRLKIPAPCMLLPQTLWSGKQVISTILLNCIPEGSPKVNLEGTAKTPVKCWKVRGRSPPSFLMSESEVVFRQGEMLSGVLDKNHFGATNYGLTHCCFELYGHRVGVRVLSCFSRLFTTYLQFHGFTLGVADILCLPNADKQRRKAVKESRKIGNQVVINTFGLSSEASEKEIKHVLAATYCNPKGIGADVAALDRGMKQAIRPFNDRINSACVPDGLIRLFPENGLQMMIESGAKGSAVNAMQISCALGQIELEGKRMATTIAGRTLPSFRAFDPSPRAGGFIDQRFLTGINPQELFFHTMAGREGLIDTAVKTSRSGYLQRCIIKHLEGIKVHYDATCRDHDGSVIQFRYGEDGMDVCGSSYMTSQGQFEFLRQNLEAVADVVKPKEFTDRQFNVHEAEEHYKKVKKYRKKLAKSGKYLKGANAGFLMYSEENSGANRAQIEQMWKELSHDERADFNRQARIKHIDAVDEKFNPARTLGALPEKMLDSIDDFCKKTKDKGEKIEEERKELNLRLFGHEEELLQTEKLRRILYWKGLKSMAAPGENVGLLAAQSIGEPSTQMTLNTFHFAGRGEMNVTLGIPRLREILMTAGKNIATPTAEIKVASHATVGDIDRIKRQLDRVFLKQVLKNFRLEERVNLQEGNCWRRYVLRIELLETAKREKEAQHLDNRLILEKIESTSTTTTGKKKLAEGVMQEEDSDGRHGKGFIQRLDLEIQKKMEGIEKQVSMHNKRIRAGNQSMGLGNEEGPSREGALAADGESSDEEADGGREADASEKKLHQRHRDDAAEYEGEEEERGAVDDAEEEEMVEDDVRVPAEGDDEDDGEANEEKRKLKTKLAEDRIRRVCAISAYVQGYAFDQMNNRWCEITFSFPLKNKSKVDLGGIVEKVIESFVVHETAGIEKCVYDPDKHMISTQGVNRTALFAFRDLIDINTFYSNDLNFMLDQYGVEACAKSIVKEMSSVFEVYGIRPSKRHLNLTADYMTFTGRIQPFNRGAMSSSASPLQKMTFETTIAFMTDTLINGETDCLSSPSSRIVLGALNRGGTGAFDIFVNPSVIS